MQGPTNERIGQLFQLDFLQLARDKTLQVVERSAALFKSGMSEIEAKAIVQKVQEDCGCAKIWHAPQIRFGANTLLPFGEKGRENQRLKEEDIFFLDLGLIFSEHEGDIGRTFCIGRDPVMNQCRQDVQAIWHLVRNHWVESQATGPELYNFARHCAEDRGWRLSLQKANGHRISDFPHAVRLRGSIEEFAQRPSANRWILEIQIRHPEQEFGAFYEDLLN